MCAAQPRCAAEGPGDLHGDRHQRAAGGHSRQGDRRRGLSCRTCGCRACCTPAWCGRRSPRRRLAASTPPPSRRCRASCKVVRDGSFLAVVAQNGIPGDQGDARAGRRRAMAGRPRRCRRRPTSSPHLPGCRRRTSACWTWAQPPRRAAKTLSARYTRPYQMHGSIGPSCAVAQFDDGTMTVWTHTQGVFPIAQAMAEMLRHAAGAGALHPCRGLRLLRPQRRRRRRRRRGADRARGARAAGARAMDARAGEYLGAVSGRRWSPKVQAALDAAGRIVDWDYDGVEQYA